MSRSSGAKLTARAIRVAELSDAEIGAWRELAAKAIEPNPFFEPEFVLPAAHHLGEDEITLLVVDDAEGWSACLPVTTMRYRRIVSVLAAWQHMYVFLGTPLVSGSDVTANVRTLLELMRDAGGWTRLMRIALIGADGHVFPAIEEAVEQLGLQTVLERRTERGLLERREDPSAYLAGVSRHRRHEHRRLARRLAEKLGAPLEVSDHRGEPAAVERFLELEESGWKGHSGTALRSTPQHAAFFRELCESYANAGRLELLDLHAAGRTIAMKCNLRCGDGTFTFKMAYDEELARFSPGVQLEVENFERFHSGEALWMDSCADEDNAMINRLWPDRRLLRTLLLGPQGLRTTTAKLGLGAMVRWRDRKERER